MQKHKSIGKIHLVLLIPILSLICTPLFPFVNNGGLWFGLPRVCIWVIGWAIGVSVILGCLYRIEPELDEEVQQYIDLREKAELSEEVEL